MIRTPGHASRRPGLAAVGLVLFASFSLSFDNFLSGGTLTAIALNSAPLLIAAIGTMALLVSGNVDLSIGSQYALVSVLTAMVARDTGSAALAVAVALGAGALLGLLNGVLVVALRVSPLIVTLATLVVYRGLAFVITEGESVFGLPSAFTAIGTSRWFGVPFPVVVALLVFGLCSWLLVATVSGLRLYAIGGNRTTAALVGVPVPFLVVATFALNGALIGLVALLTTAKLATGSPIVGAQFELAVLTAVILGGVAFTGGQGHPLGVFVGVATIGVLDAGLIFAGFADWWQQVFRGGLLLLALTADQTLARIPARGRRRGAPAAPPAARSPAAMPDCPPSPPGEVVLAVTGLSVRFAGVDALDDVTLHVRAGEVVCLVGDNGAGKSTLVKAICGAVRPTAGEVRLGGKPLAPRSDASRRAGIETVFQQPALCPNLCAPDNLALGLEPRRRLAGVLPVRDAALAERVTRVRLAELGMAVSDLRKPVSRLSGGERQTVAILRVMRPGARLVLLDEPTAALGLGQAAEVRRLARAIAACGPPVIVVTHDIAEVFEIADRVVVLQKGRIAFDGTLAQTTRLELMSLMSGRARAEAARTAQEVATERKRIERDLHDGAQQQLVNAALMLKLAANQLQETGNDNLTRLLSTTGETLRSALAELRDLSRGLYPVVLTELGLVAAVESLARSSALSVNLQASAVPRLPEQVELTAYFVVAEAMTNVAKHAQASDVIIDIRHDGRMLHVSVSDDGIGNADDSRGTGLRGLRDRVAAGGGVLSVTSKPGDGTTLAAVLPAPVSVTR